MVSESPNPSDGSGENRADAAESGADRIVVAVVRTGGIAGIRRRWRVEAPDADAGHWIALIDDCPWDAPAAVSSGADRFVWSIRARTPSERREQELPDAALDGPWLALVEAVRAAAAAPDS